MFNARYEILKDGEIVQKTNDIKLAAKAFYIAIDEKLKVLDTGDSVEFRDMVEKKFALVKFEVGKIECLH